MDNEKALDGAEEAEADGSAGAGSTPPAEDNSLSAASREAAEELRKRQSDGKTSGFGDIG